MESLLNELKSRVEFALAERYRIERELGRGGMATVYLARDLRYGRLVAIKVLYPELAASVGPQRFLREIEIAASLAHPHILPLHDSGEAGGFLYYVMPYVEGETLRARLRREIQLPVDEALRILRDVAAALSFAHERGLVHRDLKPENILLEGDRAVVADFGVARAIENAATERLTESGLAVGTPAYMSPEQAGGTGRVDGRSDIYSLGCVFYEMLAGEPPFGGATPQAIVAKHMQAPVPDLRVVRSTVTAEMQRVLGIGLAKVPADRFSNAAEFASELEASASKPALSRRRLAAAGVTALAIAFVAMLAWGGLISAGPDGNRSALSQSDPPRIAVMYFDDLSSDSALRQLADGLTEELIYELSGVSGLRVITRSGVQPFRERRVSFDSMVATLRPSTVIDGSVRRVGDVVRVRAQLIDARSNTYLDSMSLERPVTRRSGLERRMAQEIAAVLRRQMGREARLRNARLGARTGPARELVFKAQRAHEDAATLAEHPHPQDLRTALLVLGRADSLLTLAQAADPRWVRPLVDRGWVALDRASLVTGPERVTAVKAGLQLAEKAVLRAPDNAETLELRGILRWRLIAELQAAQGDPNRLQHAEADLRAALDRDSTRARAWATLGYLLWFKGNTAEAGIAARRALQEDTYLVEARGILNELFYDELMLGEFKRAAQWCERGRLTFPGDWRFVQCELTLMRHDPSNTTGSDSAWALVRELDRLDPPEQATAQGRQYQPIYRRVAAAAISARAGRPDIGRAELARARRATEGDSVLRLDLAYDEAYLRLMLGQRRQATDLLRRYLTARPMARGYLQRDPLFSGLSLPE